MKYRVRAEYDMYGTQDTELGLMATVWAVVKALHLGANKVVVLSDRTGYVARVAA